MGNLLEEFNKVQKVWPNRTFAESYAPITPEEIFELGYQAASDVAFRCITIKLNPGENHKGDVAILYNSATKQFISLLNREDGIKIDLFEETDANIDANISSIQQNLVLFKSQLQKIEPVLRDQIIKCVLVLRKIDEAIHLSLSRDMSRRVYFAIGEARERAALVPIFQNSKGSDLVQLALHKWMDAVLRFEQDTPFPQDKITPMVKNFLQIKKWLRDLITNLLAGVNTLREDLKVE
jgi:hypothetical protein